MKSKSWMMVMVMVMGAAVLFCGASWISLADNKSDAPNQAVKPVPSEKKTEAPKSPASGVKKEPASTDAKKKPKPDQRFVSALTSGEISRESTIKVQFTNDMVDAAALNSPIDPSPFTFTPAITGSAVWSSARILEFRPVDKLPPGQTYSVTVDLSNLPKKEGTQNQFSFSFTVMKQAFDIQIDGFQTPDQKDSKKLELTGKITTADVEDGANMMNILKADLAGTPLNIRWSHSKDRHEHSFTVNGIVRSDTASELTLTYDGTAIGAENSGKKTLEIPAYKPFEVLQIRAVDEAAQYIEIRFSEPVKADQDFRGLITADIQKNPRYTVEKNIVRVYDSVRWTSKITVYIEPGVKNVVGQSMGTRKTAEISFEEIKPEVRFVGKGVILPTTQGLTVPIEAVNLTAITVEAIKIYDKTTPQFLQVNDLQGDNELNRVGRPVWKKEMKLDFKPEKKNQWLRYGLDVTPLIKKEPGGLFRLKVSFNKKQIVYHCTGSKSESDSEEEPSENWDEAPSYDYRYSEGWEDDEGEDGGYYRYCEDCYENRNNPCHLGYYRFAHDHRVVAERNVLVSDIGLIAKRGNDGKIIVVATDLKTAQPMPDTAIQIMDFQQIVMGEDKTDANGMVKFTPDRKPFLIIAKKGEHTGYLKMDDGSALSVSHFDVSGETVKKGLKGFIYGERGIWRPGDHIYLTFILWDTNEKKLPENHPVTFEFRNPKGQLVKTETKKQSVSGFYFFETQTDPDAPTGNWNVKMKVGGSSFERVIRVETVMPNRLKIKFDIGEKQVLSEGEVSAVLSATWLHGAVAKNLKSDVEITFATRSTSFPNYKGYVFDDPARKYEPEKVMLFEGMLDENGRTPIQKLVKTDHASPGMLTANFKTRVFEQSGAFSTDYFSIPYHPYHRYVGIRLPDPDKAYWGMIPVDKEQTIQIALVDKDGNPVPTGEVDVNLYRLEWRWWWEGSQERTLADFVASESVKPIKTETVKIADGQGKWTFKTNEWGRFLVRVSDKTGKHITGQVFHSCWAYGQRESDQMPGGATMISLTSDKTEYQTGDKVVLTIPTGKTGKGFVSLETGTRVLNTAWIDGGKEQITYEFIATKDMAPTVYAFVSFLQPHLKAENDLPIRMYGVMPIKVTDPDTKLKPVIVAPAQFTPEQTAEIAISEAAGKPMAYTVAIVDEGLLDLTRFKTPDPWTSFYQREALGVKTWDLFDFVAGAYGGALEKLLAIGGSDEGKIKGQRKANRFPPMVRFLGPFKLEKDQQQVHKIDIPQYVGSVRIMVVAGFNGAFGSEEKAVFVRKPLMILGTLPRVLGPDEEVDLPVAVFAMEDNIKNVSVNLNVEGPISVQGDLQKSIAFSRPGDDVVSFKLKAEPKIGIAKISLNAVSGDEKAAHTIEIDVRPPGGTITDVADHLLAKNETWKQEIKFPGIAGTNKAYLEVSRIPPINLTKRLHYLIQYPHGCVEQTTSSVFPQLYLNKIIELPAEQQQQIESFVKAGIAKLQNFQTPQGGFWYWPGAGGADDWASSYAGHFLVEAEKAGYSVPSAMLNSWKEYQRKTAQSWMPAPNYYTELMQAYRLYTLALAGSAELGAMNRLREINLSAAARWRLAAAYQLAGQPEAAKKIAEDSGLDIKPYRELSYTYGSDLRDKAMIVETLCLMGEFKKAVPLMKEISERLSGDSWESTQTTAYALIAAAKYTGLSGEKGEVKYTYSWNGGQKYEMTSPTPIFQRPLDTANLTSGTIEIHNLGDVTIYPRIVSEGIAAPGAEKSASNGLSLTVSYYLPVIAVPKPETQNQSEEPDEGEKPKKPAAPPKPAKGAAVNPADIEQGTDFIAEITVKNTGTRGEYKEVALSWLAASGWEIHNERMAPGVVPSKVEYKYQDVRDDRVYTYFDLKQGQSKTFKILLNAAYQGKFYLPMTGVEAMYDATINARIPGKWVTVGKK